MKPHRWQFSLRSLLTLTTVTAFAVALAATNLEFVLALAALGLLLAIVVATLWAGTYVTMRAPKFAASVCAILGTLLMVIAVAIGVTITVSTVPGVPDPGFIWICVSLLLTVGLLFYHAARSILLNARNEHLTE